MKTVHFLIFTFLVTGFFSCDLEREIQVDLPPFVKQYMVECYLEEGEQLRLLLTETFAPNDIPNQIPFATGATVVIKHNERIDTLEERLVIDPVSLKVFNYVNNFQVQKDLDANFELEITTSDGTKLLSNTRFLETIPIDSTVIKFNEDTLASFQVWFTDVPGVKNYYRFTLHEGSIRTEPEQVFALDDDIFDGDDTVFGTGFEYESGDTLVATLWSIDRAYHDFLETVTAAQSANNNPFAQPSSVVSNIDGGIGIFTTVNFDRVQNIIPD